MTIKLTFGVSESDRMGPLVDGTVPIEGVEATWNVHGVQALFNKQLSDHAYDACEFPLGTYLRDMEGARRYLAVPVFPSRHFRLSCVFTHRDAGISKPADLAGKRIGIPVWDMAAAVWLRGMFQDYYDLPRTAPIYVTNGLEEARTGDEHPQVYPDGFQIEHSHAEGGLAGMLARGEIDALYTARAPSTYVEGGSVTRLFDDPMSADMAYYEMTGIYPPMHVLCVKREIAAANPGLTRALFDAFTKAQEEARARLYDSAALSVMLPWALEHLTMTERKLGKDYWSTGLARNRDTLDTIIRYTREDGLIEGAFSAADLFDTDMADT